MHLDAGEETAPEEQPDNHDEEKNSGGVATAKVKGAKARQGVKRKATKHEQAEGNNVEVKEAKEEQVDKKEASGKGKRKAKQVA